MRATTCGVSSVYSCKGRPSQKEIVTSRKSRMAAVISGYRAVAARRAYSTTVRVLPPLVKLPEIPRSVVAIKYPPPRRDTWRKSAQDCLKGGLKSEELPNTIAPKGQWILTGGATPGVRNPSLFSPLHPRGGQAMPSAERLLFHFFSRAPPGRRGEGA